MWGCQRFLRALAFWILKAGDEMDASQVTASNAPHWQNKCQSHFERHPPRKLHTFRLILPSLFFQLAAFNRANKVIFNRKVSRAKLIDEVRQLPSGICIAMEACASAHHWGRTFIEMCYAVALIPPQHVKAFCRVHKSDGHDAIAIGSAAQRPNLHTVPVKSIGQQDLAMLMHLRDRITRERTRTANQMRGFAAEYGVCFPTKISMLLQGITEALAKEQCGLSPVVRVSVAELMEHIKLLTTRIDALMRQATELAKLQPAFKRLQTIPGIGPVITCTLMAAIGNGHQFDRGRSVAAWLGLVPRTIGTKRLPAIECLKG